MASISVKAQVPVKDTIGSVKDAVTISYSEPAPSPEVREIPSPVSDKAEELAGKKLTYMGRPDDRARHLASQLSLEEQVRSSFHPPHLARSNVRRSPSWRQQIFGELSRFLKKAFQLSRQQMGQMVLVGSSSQTEHQ